MYLGANGVELSYRPDQLKLLRQVVGATSLGQGLDDASRLGAEGALQPLATLLSLLRALALRSLSALVFDAGR